MLKTPLATGSAAIAAILASNFLAGAAFAAGSPLGVWLDDRGRGAIEISPCGSALCGKVVWVKSSSDAKGCGAKILGSVKKVGSRTWDHGWIYSPDHGRRFDVALQPVGNDRLRVTGYAGIKLFGESRMWTRAPADLKRCDAPATSAEVALRNSLRVSLAPAMIGSPESGRPSEVTPDPIRDAVRRQGVSLGPSDRPTDGPGGPMCAAVDGRRPLAP